MVWEGHREWRKYLAELEIRELQWQSAWNFRRGNVNTPWGVEKYYGRNIDRGHLNGK
jgi:hypothetical protein